ATGTISGSYAYDTFGNALLTGSFVNPYRYTARDYDSETGLQYSRARYYDPQIGRFLSEDPIGFIGGGPNFYQYVQNSPTRLRDPSGINAGAASLPAVGGTVTTICFGTGICETVITVGGVVVGSAGFFYMLSHAKPVAPYETDWRKQPQFQCGKRR